MKPPNVDGLLEGLVARDPRYPIEAYAFVRSGLDFTVHRLRTSRHVRGQELLAGIREFAIQEFGPMSKTVLNGWGIVRTEDVGEIVFNMIECGLLGKTDEDDRADFANGFDFDEAFRKPFSPPIRH